MKPSRSGFGKEKTKYTEKGPGTPGGSSWTVEWLKFDNSYFKVPTAALCLRMIIIIVNAAFFNWAPALLCQLSTLGVLAGSARACAGSHVCSDSLQGVPMAALRI